MKLGCHEKPLKREEIEYKVHELIRTVFTQPAVLRSLLAKRFRGGALRDEQQQLLQRARSEISRLKNERARLLNLRAKDLFSEEEIEKEAHRINGEIAPWNATISRVERDMANAVVTDENIAAAAIASVFAEFESLQKTERRNLLHKFVSALFVDGGTITKATVRVPVGSVLKLEMPLTKFRPFFL